MAENFPRTVPDFLAWSRVHAERWAVDPVALGLSPAQSAEFSALAAELQAAHAAAIEARQASMAATQNLNNVLSTTRRRAGEFAGVIKAFARVSGNEGVYVAAGLSPADPPGTLPSPVPPRSFRGRVNPDGSVTISWTARQPHGVTDVSYLVYRRLEGEAERELLGVAGRSKTFTDLGLPRGVSAVEYSVVPRRGQRVGESSPMFQMLFGSAERGVGVGIDSRAIDVARRAA